MMKTVRDWLATCERALAEAGLHFGHGTDNAHDESAWLVLHVLGVPLDGSFSAWDAPVGAAEAGEIQRLLDARIQQRKPLAYLLGQGWFCGLPFEVDESVLVPRSPIGELIQSGFSPWVQPRQVHRVLDLCTGSGCIAIATALHLDHVTVDAVDISDQALEVAQRNVDAHGVGDRVRLWRSDLFNDLGSQRWDLIVSNPPYVSAAEMERFPGEYRWEPALGFHARDEGLELVLRILRESAKHLQEQGVLICEVGEAAGRLEARLPQWPLTWIEFEHGGEGVFTIDRSKLEDAAARSALGGSSC